jgi:hypothetical protein
VYLERVSQVVGWARQAGVYVILDMHQNSFSRYLAADRSPPFGIGESPALSDFSGAPAWAVFAGDTPSVKYFGQREFNPAVQLAFTNFWLNARVPGNRGTAPGTGLQDHYIGALAALTRRFKDNSTVAGFNIFNEPSSGLIPFGIFEDAFLVPFYRRVLDAVVGSGDGLACPASFPGLPFCGYPDLGIHDRRHLFFLDPNVFRAVTDLPTHLALPLSAYPNLVYGIHAYTHVYTLDRLAGAKPSTSPYPLSYDQSYAFADRGARMTNAALFVTEYGGNPGEDGEILEGQLREQEKALTGSAFWIWKENCTYGVTWGVTAGVYGERANQRCAYDQRQPDLDPKPSNGGIRSRRAQLLARAWPRAVTGSSVSYSYDPERGRFLMKATAGPLKERSRDSETVVYLPTRVTGSIWVGGAAQLDTVVPQADGSRLVFVAPTGGDYEISAG